jgi:hypothetical protein
MIRIGFLPLYPSFRKTLFRHAPVPEKKSPVHGFVKIHGVTGAVISPVGGGTPGTNLKL